MDGVGSDGELEAAADDDELAGDDHAEDAGGEEILTQAEKELAMGRATGAGRRAQRAMSA